mgnify:CR=1 FL=1
MTFLLGFISGIIFTYFIKILSQSSNYSKIKTDRSKTHQLLHQAEFNRLIPEDADITSLTDPETLPDFSKISKIKPIYINKIN